MSNTKDKDSTRKPPPKVDFFADLKARAGNAQRLAVGGEEGEKIELLAVDTIEPNPEQPRRQPTPVEDAELAEDIKQRGILQPILVRPLSGKGDKYLLVAGERRWRAAQTAGLKVIPALVKDYNDREARAVAAVENLQRKDLEPLDEAHYFKFLADEYNLSNRDIAALIHKSASYVDQRVRLLDKNRVKNTQTLQKSQDVWKYRPQDWTRFHHIVTQAHDGLKSVKPKDKAVLRETVQQLRQELERLAKELGDDS